jgi:hypothetical protein
VISSGVPRFLRRLGWEGEGREITVVILKEIENFLKLIFVEFFFISGIKNLLGAEKEILI